MRRFVVRLQPLETEISDAIERLFAAFSRTLALIDPLQLEDVIGQIFSAVREQVHVLDPDALAESAQALLDELKAPLATLDPAKVAERLGAAYARAIAAITDALKAFLDTVAKSIDARLKTARKAVAKTLKDVAAVVKQAGEALGDVGDELDQLVLRRAARRASNACSRASTRASIASWTAPARRSTRCSRRSRWEAAVAEVAVERLQDWMRDERARRRVRPRPPTTPIVEETGGGRFAYRYDRRGDLVGIAGPGGAARDLRLRRAPPAHARAARRAVTTFAYEGEQLRAVVDATGERRYEYDAAGGSRATAPTASATTSAAGSPRRARRPCATAHDFDDDGRLVGIRQEIDGVTLEARMDFDADGPPAPRCGCPAASGRRVRVGRRRAGR